MKDTQTKRPSFLSQEKKSRSDFWKSRESGYSSSNYWLKDSIFDRKKSDLFDDEPTLERTSRYDHMQLAQYQRAISNFVRILTGRGDIVVKYNDGGKSYTDGKTITLSPNIKEKEFDTAVGLALHEASHILYTDFNSVTGYITGAANVAGSRWDEKVIFRKTILNIVEDLYIDSMTYKAAPGYRGYYSSLYQKYFGDKRIVEGMWSQDKAEPTMDNYEFHICNIRNPKRNLDALPGLKEIFNAIDLQNITRLSSQEDRIKLASVIYDEVMKWVDATKEYHTAQQEQQQGGGASGEGMTTEELNEMLEQMADAEGGDEQDGDANDATEQDGQNGQGTGNAGNKFVASNGIPIEEEIDSTNVVDLDKLSEKAKKQLDKLINQQREFINGNVQKGKLSKVDQQKVDAYASVDMERKTINPTDSNFGRKGIPLYIIRDITPTFMDTLGFQFGFRSISYAGPYRKNIIEEGINRGKMLAKKLQLRNEERVLKTSRLDAGKIDKRLLHEVGFGNFDIFSKVNITTYKPSYIHICIDQSGSMDGDRFNNAMAFAAMFATASKYINNIHVQISIRSTFDGAGKNQWRANENTPYLIYIFDSKKHGIQHIRNVFPRLHATQLTPEGLVFDGIMKETIQQAQNTDAYFINICDGEPYLRYYNTHGSFNYEGSSARHHSKAQMKRMEQNGIKFITYFIGGRLGFEKVEECYGTNAVHLTSATEVVKVAASMNKKLLAA
jgi:Ca2+-binding EF-hand superfamily protein